MAIPADWLQHVVPPQSDVSKYFQHHFVSKVDHSHSVRIQMAVCRRAWVPIELQFMSGIRLGDTPHLLRRNEQAFLVEPSFFAQPCERHDICIWGWPEAGGKHRHGLARTPGIHADRLDLNP